VELENEADVLIARLRALFVGGVREIFAANPNFSAFRSIKQAQQIKKRALSTAGRPHDRGDGRRRG
jgi:hypothetical protein